MSPADSATAPLLLIQIVPPLLPSSGMYSHVKARANVHACHVYFFFLSLSPPFRFIYTAFFLFLFFFSFFLPSPPPLVRSFNRTLMTRRLMF